MTATEIAQRISSLAEEIMQGGSLEGLSNEIASLWKLARQSGLEREVDAILQKQSLEEMEEAINALAT